MDIPYFASDRCTGYGACVAICPGLAITLVRSIEGGQAEIVVPWEFNIDFEIGATKELVDQDGNRVQSASVVSIRKSNARNTWLLTFRVNRENASKISGVRVAKEVAPKQSPASKGFDNEDDALLDTVLCRCERVTLREAVEFIKKYRIRDANQLKSIRVGMGACGGKTCAQLITKAFSIAGIDASGIEPMTQRPLFMEVPMSALVNEGLYKLGGKDAGIRGAP
jgi:ferredoxin